MGKNKQAKKQKPYNIKIHRGNKALIIISTMIILIALIVSWALWYFLYNDIVTGALTLVNLDLKKMGYNVTLDINDLTGFTWGYVLLGLITGFLPFMFFKNKHFVSFIGGFFTLLFSLVIIASVTIIILMFFNTLNGYAENFKIENLVIFVVPWSVEGFFALLLLIGCLWFLFSFVHHNAHKSENQTNKHHAKKSKDARKKELSDSKRLLNEIAVNSKKESTTVPEIKIYINEEHGKTNVVTSSAQTHHTPNTNKHKREVEPLPVLEKEDHEVRIPDTKHQIIHWTTEQIDHVWEKGEIVNDFDPKLYRKDYAGALMCKKDFVNHPTAQSENSIKSYKWTITLQKPVSHGGSVEINNLQPMNTLNVISKADNYPKWRTTITFDGTENTIKEQKWKIRK